MDHRKLLSVRPSQQGLVVGTPCSIMWAQIRRCGSSCGGSTSSKLELRGSFHLSPRSDALGQHSLVCKQVPSRIARHQHLNDLMTRVLVSVGVPVTKEPVSHIRRDGKRPDRMTQIQWRSGKLLVWDVTVVSTTAESYVAATAHGRGEAAEMAATRKCQKYSELSTAYLFLPIAGGDSRPNE